MSVRHPEFPAFSLGGGAVRFVFFPTAAPGISPALHFPYGLAEVPASAALREEGGGWNARQTDTWLNSFCNRAISPPYEYAGNSGCRMRMSSSMILTMSYTPSEIISFPKTLCPHVHWADNVIYMTTIPTHNKIETKV